MLLALASLAGITVIALLVGGRVRAVDLIVCGLPIASVLGGSVRVNLSPADLFLPIALLGIAAQARRAEVLRPLDAKATFDHWTLYLGAVSAVCLLGLCVRVMRGFDTDLTYGLAGLVKLWTSFAYLGVFTFYGVKLFEGGDRLLRLWVRISCIAAVAGIGGVLLFSRGIENPFSYSYRAQGGFDDPNLFASYLLLGISLTFVAHSRRLIRFPSLIVGTLSVALVLTGSRAAIPALAIGVAASVVLGRGGVAMRRIVPWFLVLGAAFAIVAWESPALLGLDSLTRVTTAASTSTEQDIRFTLWRVAWEMWLDNPFIGVGLGQYIPASPDYYPGGLSNIPHSSHLSLLAETGTAGYLLVMGLPLLIALRVSRWAKRSTDPAPTWMLLGIAGSLAMAWTLNLENSRMLWAFLGLCLGYCVSAARGTLVWPPPATPEVTPSDAERGSGTLPTVRSRSSSTRAPQ